MAYVVSLKQFDGPLDLLLTLISRAKIDIRDIFVSEITEQYLESISDLSMLDMDSASEFLQMASTLIEIKSRALLPTPPAVEEGEESPEEALIRQLTEYKAFKELCEKMRPLEEAAKLLVTKLPEEFPLPPPTVELTGLTTQGLANAFSRVMERLQNRTFVEERAAKELRRDTYTVQGCVSRIQSRVRKGRCAFSALFDDVQSRDEVVTMFLALLELLRLNRIQASQEGVYAEIWLEKGSK
ncbi:MAG: segregation and condensation protein A [Christensenellales bacterium]|jgi:segregation and condensation protein A